MPIVFEFKNDTVNLVETRARGNVFDVKKSCSISIPEEWIDSSGIREMDDLYLLLSSTMDMEDFRTKDAMICINNSSVIYREIIVQSMDKKKMALVVRSEMMDVLNLTPDYIMDFIVVDEFEGEDGKSMSRLLAVASLSSALESYIEIMKKLKLKLTCIDTASNAIIKLVDNNPELKAIEQLILVDIGRKQLRLYFFELGKYILTRNAKISQIDDVTDEEALNIIEDNINKMIQFSFTRDNKSGDKRIILAGRDEILEELKLMVLNDLLVPCEIATKPSFINVDNGFETNYINAYSALIRK